MIATSTVLATDNGTFRVCMHRDARGQSCVTLSQGDVGTDGVVVRLHSSCVFGEAFGACDCDCGPQLVTALREIDRRGAGVLVYFYQEGRGAGLESKIAGMEYQRLEGKNSYEAYEAIGLARDSRDYGVGFTALQDLGVARRMTLMCNNPTKQAALEAAGYEVVEHLALGYEVSSGALDYLEMKRTAGRHEIDFAKITFRG